MALNLSSMTPQEQIATLFIAYFDRAPAPSGLDYWVGRLNDGMSIAEIATSFATQPETLKLYPELGAANAATPTSNLALVTDIFNNLFGREPAGGVDNFWVQQLNNGADIGSIIINIASGAVGDDKALLENKIEVGLDWSTEALIANIATVDNPLSQVVDGELVILDQEAYESAKTVLDTVTEDPATVDAAKAVTDDFITNYGNDAPIAANDTAAVNEDGVLDDGVVSTAADPDGDALAYSVAAGGAPANGTVVMNADGTYVYTPDADFNGTDTFTYTVTDPSGETDSATVTVTVAPQNDAPIAGAIQGGATEGGAVATVDLKDVTSDVDGDALTYALVTSADGLSIDASTGVVSLDPTVAAYKGLAQGETRQVEATYSVTDGTVTVQNTITFTVTGTNDAPTASDLTVGGIENITVLGAVTANDVNGDVLTYSAENAVNGAVSMDAGTGAFEFEPDANFAGVASFEFTVTDIYGDSVTKTVTLNFADVVYTLTPSASTVDEGEVIVFTLNATNTDAGTEFDYTITGVTAGDVASGALTGAAVIDEDGKAEIQVNLAADRATEGAETLTLSVAGETASVEVADTSLSPTYTLTPSASTVDEGDSVVFTLSTTNVDQDATFAYTITGVSPADLVGGESALTGIAMIGGDGLAEIEVQLVADATTEALEALTMTFAGIGVSASVDVNDTSVNTEQRFTTQPDDIEGNTFGNLFIGRVSNEAMTSGVASTYQEGDAADGGTGGDNTLRLFMDPGSVGDGVEISNIQNLDLRLNAGDSSVSTGSTKLIMTDWDDSLEQIDIRSNKSTLEIREQQTVTDISITDNSTDAANSGYSFNYAAGVLEGTEDRVSLTVDNVNGTGGSNVTFDEGIEAVDITVSDRDAAQYESNINLNAAGAGEIIVTGGNDGRSFTLNADVEAGADFDSTQFAGDMDLTSAKIETARFGAGDDTAVIDGQADLATSSYNLGSGDNSITIGIVEESDTDGLALGGKIVASDGNDAVTVHGDVLATGSIALGDGDNTIRVVDGGSDGAGDMLGSITVGDDTNTVAIDNDIGASAEDNATAITFGDGDNTLAVGFSLNDDGTWSFTNGNDIKTANIQFGDGHNLVVVNNDIEGFADLSFGTGNNRILVGDEIRDNANISFAGGDNAVEVLDFYNAAPGPIAGGDLTGVVPVMASGSSNLEDSSSITFGGDGTNVLNVLNDIQDESTVTFTGNGNNSVTVGGNVINNATLAFGDGNNVMSVEGEISGSSASPTSGVSVTFGNGNNTLTVGGVLVDGVFSDTGASDADGGVENATISFGGGTNFMQVDDSVIQSSITFSDGDNNQLIVGGNVQATSPGTISFGDGAGNELSIAGNLDGDAVVFGDGAGNEFSVGGNLDNAGSITAGNGGNTGTIDGKVATGSQITLGDAADNLTIGDFTTVSPLVNSSAGSSFEGEDLIEDIATTIGMGDGDDQLTLLSAGGTVVGSGGFIHAEGGTDDTLTVKTQQDDDTTVVGRTQHQKVEIELFQADVDSYAPGDVITISFADGATDIAPVSYMVVDADIVQGNGLATSQNIAAKVAALFVDVAEFDALRQAGTAGELNTSVYLTSTEPHQDFTITSSHGTVTVMQISDTRVTGFEHVELVVEDVVDLDAGELPTTASLEPTLVSADFALIEGVQTVLLDSQASLDSAVETFTSALKETLDNGVYTKNFASGAQTFDLDNFEGGEAIIVRGHETSTTGNQQVARINVDPRDDAHKIGEKITVTIGETVMVYTIAAEDLTGGVNNEVDADRIAAKLGDMINARTEEHGFTAVVDVFNVVYNKTDGDGEDFDSGSVDNFGNYAVDDPIGAWVTLIGASDLQATVSVAHEVTETITTADTLSITGAGTVPTWDIAAALADLRPGDVIEVSLGEASATYTMTETVCERLAADEIAASIAEQLGGDVTADWGVVAFGANADVVVSRTEDVAVSSETAGYDLQMMEATDDGVADVIIDANLSEGAADTTMQLTLDGYGDVDIRIEGSSTGYTDLGLTLADAHSHTIDTGGDQGSFTDSITVSDSEEVDTTGQTITLENVLAHSVDTTAAAANFTIDQLSPREPVKIGGNPGTSNLTYDATFDDDATVTPFTDPVTIDGEHFDVEPGHRIKGAAVVPGFVPGVQLSVPDTFDDYGDDEVHDSQYEIYHGTYDSETGIFEVTLTRGTAGDPGFEDVVYPPAPQDAPTHTLMLYDNDPSDDVAFIEGLVFAGFFQEQAFNFAGSGSSRVIFFNDNDGLYVPFEDPAFSAEEGGFASEVITVTTADGDDHLTTFAPSALAEGSSIDLGAGSNTLSLGWGEGVVLSSAPSNDAASVSELVSGTSSKSAYSIDVGQAVQATLFDANDEDTFQVTLEAGKLYQISAFTQQYYETGSANDIVLRLYDAELNEIEAGSVPGYPLDLTYWADHYDQDNFDDEGLGEYRLFAPTETGTYHFEVGPYASDPGLYAFEVVERTDLPSVISEESDGSDADVGVWVNNAFDDGWFNTLPSSEPVAKVPQGEVDLPDFARLEDIDYSGDLDRLELLNAIEIFEAVTMSMPGGVGDVQSLHFADVRAYDAGSEFSYSPDLTIRGAANDFEITSDVDFDLLGSSGTAGTLLVQQMSGDTITGALSVEARNDARFNIGNNALSSLDVAAGDNAEIYLASNTEGAFAIDAVSISAGGDSDNAVFNILANTGEEEDRIGITLGDMSVRNGNDADLNVQDNAYMDLVVGDVELFGNSPDLLVDNNTLSTVDIASVDISAASRAGVSVSSNTDSSVTVSGNIDLLVAGNTAEPAAEVVVSGNIRTDVSLAEDGAITLITCQDDVNPDDSARLAITGNVNDYTRAENGPDNDDAYAMSYSIMLGDVIMDSGEDAFVTVADNDDLTEDGGLTVSLGDLDLFAYDDAGVEIGGASTGNTATTITAGQIDIRSQDAGTVAIEGNQGVVYETTVNSGGEPVVTTEVDYADVTVQDVIVDADGTAGFNVDGNAKSLVEAGVVDLTAGTGAAFSVSNNGDTAVVLDTVDIRAVQNVDIFISGNTEDDDGNAAYPLQASVTTGAITSVSGASTTITLDGNTGVDGGDGDSVVTVDGTIDVTSEVNVTTSISGNSYANIDLGGTAAEGEAKREVKLAATTGSNTLTMASNTSATIALASATLTAQAAAGVMIGGMNASVENNGSTVTFADLSVASTDNIASFDIRSNEAVGDGGNTVAIAGAVSLQGEAGAALNIVGNDYLDASIAATDETLSTLKIEGSSETSGSGDAGLVVTSNSETSVRLGNLDMDTTDLAEFVVDSNNASTVTSGTIDIDAVGAAKFAVTNNLNSSLIELAVIRDGDGNVTGRNSISIDAAAVGGYNAAGAGINGVSTDTSGFIVEQNTSSSVFLGDVAITAKDDASPADADIVVDINTAGAYDIGDVTGIAGSDIYFQANGAAEGVSLKLGDISLTSGDFIPEAEGPWESSLFFKAQSVLGNNDNNGDTEDNSDGTVVDEGQSISLDARSVVDTGDEDGNVFALIDDAPDLVSLVVAGTNAEIYLTGTFGEGDEFLLDLSEVVGGFDAGAEGYDALGSGASVNGAQDDGSYVETWNADFGGDVVRVEIGSGDLIYNAQHSDFATASYGGTNYNNDWNGQEGWFSLNGNVNYLDPVRYSATVNLQEPGLVENSDATYEFDVVINGQAYNVTATYRDPSGSPADLARGSTYWDVSSEALPLGYSWSGIGSNVNGGLDLTGPADGSWDVEWPTFMNLVSSSGVSVPGTRNVAVESETFGVPATDGFGNVAKEAFSFTGSEVGEVVIGGFNPGAWGSINPDNGRLTDRLDFSQFDWNGDGVANDAGLVSLSDFSFTVEDSDGYFADVVIDFIGGENLSGDRQSELQTTDFDSIRLVGVGEFDNAVDLVGASMLIA